MNDVAKITCEAIEVSPSKKFYNCHAHCFTYHHVPEYFLTRYIKVSTLLKLRWLKSLIRTVPLTGKFNTVLEGLLFFLGLFFGIKKSMVIRYMSFVRFGDQAEQKCIIKSMQAYYPNDTGLVMLSMDMEYMGAGNPIISYEDQLTELRDLKDNTDFKNIIYPFIFCDPRRIKPHPPRETCLGKKFTCIVFEKTMHEFLASGTFQGIKIYPALGYHAFDLRLKTTYDFALANDIPILTHCTIGAVHFKYKLDKEERYRPFLKRHLPDIDPMDFQQYFTHPLNFECLLNKDILNEYWNNETDYKCLKICLAHWGSDDDWHSYLNDDWRETDYEIHNPPYSSLELGNWVTDDSTAFKNFSWFTIICDMMRKYPNVYADISFTLNDPTLLPLLKMILEAEGKIRERVLFGTDFYLVSKASSERAFAINVRSTLGNHLFEQISITNAKRFLSNRFSPF